MPGPYYRMPSGKLPMIDGKPVFITEAQFLGCCCNMCQWKATYIWDYANEQWLPPTEEDETLEWIPAEEDPGIYDENTCTKIVYGEIANCLIDPRPDEPDPPPNLTPAEIDECCSCPCQPWPPAEFPCEGLLENYIVDFYLAFIGDLEPFEFITESRGTVMVSAFSLISGRCAWRALGATTEIRFYGSEGWGEWEEMNRDVTLQFLPDNCVYDLSISTLGDGRKQPGGGPTGNYEQVLPSDPEYQFTTLSVS